ncbi:MAG: hypothetical protein KW793_04725, partial [Candidatus Doudnabacteria bacterium]|nr:hypothetical protein [Candidatus Doudnabacteria bacterium]
VSKVEFYIGNLLASSDSSAPFSYDWNTASYPNGSISLKAQAYDQVGNNNFSTAIVNVSNNISLNPVISLSPSTLSFNAVSGDAAPATKTINIANTGSADLNWTAATSQNWCQVSPASGTLAPQDSSLATVSVSSPTNVGSFICDILVSDVVATNSPQTTRVTYTVSAPSSSDTTPPAVSITSPAANSQVPSKGNVNISVSASDQSGVSSIQIYIDQQLVKVCTGVTSCTYKWSVNKVSAGSHLIMTQAADPSNNTSSASITVTK